MAKCLCIVWWLLLARICYCQARYWITPGGGSWSIAANWSASSGGSGGASVPGAGAEVIFDDGFNGVVEMDVIPATNPFIYSIGSLHVKGGSQVTLQRTQAGGGTRTLQLSGTSGTSPGLQIETGSTLIIDAVNTAAGSLDFQLALTGDAGVTGEIAGQLYFKGSGLAGACAAALRLQQDVTHYASLIVQRGGTIKYFNNTGNTSPSTGSYLTMDAGSVYELEKNGGSFPAGVWHDSSLAKVENLSGQNPPVFLGSVYGNMEWNCPAQIIYNLNNNLRFNNIDFVNTHNVPFRVKGGSSAGNYTLTINGNLMIRDQSWLELVGSGSPAGTSGSIILKGNLIVMPGGILTTAGVSGTASRFLLEGSSVQDITVQGLLSGTRMEFIMNGAGARLLTPLIIPGTAGNGASLQLVNGKILSTMSNLLTVLDEGSVSGGSVSSFIDGPVRKVGDNPFSFPVGTGSIYAPIRLNNVSGQSNSDVFIASYHRANPQSTVPYGPMVVNGLDHVSFVEYWTLEEEAGSSSKTISLDVHQQSFCHNLARTYVSRWNGMHWTNEGSTNGGVNLDPPYETGTITSQQVISSFGPAPNAFTIATDLPHPVNPLPARLLVFRLESDDVGQPILKWKLSEQGNIVTHFEIERAVIGKPYERIATVNSVASLDIYEYIDRLPVVAPVYYRIIAKGGGGGTLYISPVIKWEQGDKDPGVRLRHAMVLSTRINVVIESTMADEIEMMILDMQGRVVYRRKKAVGRGRREEGINIEGLARGTYQLVAVGRKGKTNVVRFVR